MTCITSSRALARPAVLTALAALALAACGSTADPPTTAPAESTEATTSSPTELPTADTPTDEPSTGTSTSAAASTSTSGSASPSSEDPAARVPSTWAGTVLADPGPARTSRTDGTGYYLALPDYEDRTTLTSRQVEQTEVIGGFVEDDQGYTPACTGTADTGGSMATCTLTGDSGGSHTSEVALVRTAFGHTQILVHVDGEGSGPLTAPVDTPIVLGASEEHHPGNVTADAARDTVIQAVMLAEAPDGDIPGGVDATCQVLDGGDHLVCDVTGTPDGGGDGTWYGTVQPGGDTRTTYLFGLLPES